MKRILYLTATFIALQSHAQKFTSGLQINYLKIEVIGTQNTDNGAGYTPNFEKANANTSGVNLNGVFGYHPSIYKFNDDLSLGVSLNIGIGYLFAPKLEGLNGSLIIDFPEYVTFRYGKHASKDSDKKIGLAIGVGYDYTQTRLPYQGVSMMGEVSFEKISVRLNSNLQKYTYYSYFTSEGAKPAYSVLPFGIQILFNY